MLAPLLLVALATTSHALAIYRAELTQRLILELAPGVTRHATEAEMLALKAEGVNFMDITNYGELSALAKRQSVAPRAVVFPSSITKQAAVNPLLPKLDKTLMRSQLQRFSDFQNRYANSNFGVQSSAWLLGQVQAIIANSGAKGATAVSFPHTNSQQPSIVAKISGKSAKTIVLGAHQDSINLRGSVTTNRAPGADDNGSGSITILEAFRVLLSDPVIASGQAPNTIEFHWYAAEELGLRGSQDIFQTYARQSRDVKAMLNQDMTGYVKPGTKAVIGLMTDFTDAGLTDFVRKTITAYCTIPYANTKCGYACSDHASANRAGYASALATEAKFEDASKLIHTDQDTISTVNFDHVLENARMSVGFAYELAFAPF